MHLLPGNPKAVQIGKLWSDFMLLIKALKEDYISTEKVLEIHRKIKRWMGDFLATFQAKDITPYMHAFLYHVVEMLIMHKNINFFNQQGLEKLNDSCTKDFFKSTNMKEMDALKQIMYKRHRIQVLEMEGHARVERANKCSNCSMGGHSIRTCQDKCMYCDSVCFVHFICRKMLTTNGFVPVV